MYWSGGMDDSIVIIASDCMGNGFGFERCIHDERPDEAPVMVFDHDFDTIEKEFESFDEWLKSFIDMEARPTRP